MTKNIISILFGITTPWLLIAMINSINGDDKYMFYILYSLMAGFIALLSYFFALAISHVLFQNRSYINNTILICITVLTSLTLKYLLLSSPHVVYGYIAWFVICTAIFFIIKYATEKYNLTRHSSGTTKKQVAP